VQADHGMPIRVEVGRAEGRRELAGNRTAANHVPRLAAVGRQVGGEQACRANLGAIARRYEDAIYKIEFAIGIVA